MSAPESCEHRECEGVRILGEHCLAHLTPSQWEGEMKRLRDGAPLAAGGVAVSQALFAVLLGALGRDPTGRVRLPSVDFGGARVFCDVSLSRGEVSCEAR